MPTPRTVSPLALAIVRAAGSLPTAHASDANAPDGRAASATPWYPGLAGILGRERIVGPASMRLNEELLALFVHRCGCPPQRAEVAVGLLTTWVHGRALLGHSDLEPIPGRWLEEFVPEGYPLSSRAQMVDDPQRAELALLLDALFTGCGSTAAGPVHS
ncbi:MAG: hypothetical protein WAV52_02300 [Luteococcus japonicus]